MSPKRISAILTVLSLFLSTSLAAPDAQAASYSFTTFDVPGAISTHATSINASGQVTGNYTDGSWGHHGFVYSNGTFTTLDVPGAVGTLATSINDGGQVTGHYSDGSRGHGFVYGNGTFTIFDSPDATSIHTTSINASGQVTGHYSDGSRGHGFVYSNSTFTILDAPGAVSTWATSINASGQVTGYYDRHGMVLGFVYSDGTFTTLDVPGSDGFTLPASINASGQVTGDYSDGSGSHGFVYNDGTFTTLDVPNASSTLPVSINTSGLVAGRYCNSIGSVDCHGFVYGDGTFTTFDVPGAAGTRATSINSRGQVAGYYYYYPEDYPFKLHSFIATPVCATPTVTVHTFTTVPHVGRRIIGSITHEGTPLCALVLANGQFLFTCGDPLPKGDFDLTVPVDDQGQITLFGFSSGLAPFQQTLGPGALPASVNATGNATRCAIPKVTYTTAAAHQGQFRLTGSITLDSTPLCALVLANGQSMFTCGDPLPKGNFDLTVPPDDQGQITLFGFAAGLEPSQQTFSPSSTPP